METFVIVGAGGIGFYLAPKLARMLAFEYSEEVSLYIVDGDIVEDRNLSRVFSEGAIGKAKAEVLAEELAPIVGDKIQVIPLQAYVSDRTLYRTHRVWNADGVTVFGCVDNLKTRAFLCEELTKHNNATYIDGGNDYETGQANLWIRRDGEDLTPKITEIAPEILDIPEDDNFPDQLDCSLEYPSHPQLALTNDAVATAMASLWYSQIVIGDLKPGEIINQILVNSRQASAHQFVRESLATT